MRSIKPTISFAGTPRDRMAEALAAVANALEAAERLMGEATPNGRDYHDQSLWRADREESDRRIRLVEELRRQYWAEAMEVQE
jgi:hypothetical protein